MNQIERACWERWISLKSCLNLIRLKRENGLDVQSDKEYAARVLLELRLYYDADLMPKEIRTEYESKVPDFTMQ